MNTLLNSFPEELKKSDILAILSTLNDGKPNQKKSLDITDDRAMFILEIIEYLTEVSVCVSDKDFDKGVSNKLNDLVNPHSNIGSILNEMMSPVRLSGEYHRSLDDIFKFVRRVTLDIRNHAPELSKLIEDGFTETLYRSSVTMYQLGLYLSTVYLSIYMELLFEFVNVIIMKTMRVIGSDIENKEIDPSTKYMKSLSFVASILSSDNNMTSLLSQLKNLPKIKMPIPSGSRAKDQVGILKISVNLDTVLNHFNNFSNTEAIHPDIRLAQIHMVYLRTVLCTDGSEGHPSIEKDLQKLRKRLGKELKKLFKLV